MMQTVTRNRSHTRFYWLLGLLLGLISARYALQIDIPRMVFLGVILVIVLLGDPDEILAMSICCIPLHESIDFFFALMFCLIAFVLRYPGRVRLNPTIIPVLAMMVWELLHCFGGAFSIREYITGFVPLLFLAVLMCTNAAEFDYGFIVRVFAATTAATCISLLLKLLYLSGFNFAVAFAGLQRLGLDTEETKQSLDITGGELNPNTLGIICVLTTTGLMQLRTAGQGKRKDILLAIVLLVFGTLTSSRTYLACLAVMALLLLFSQRGSLTRKFQFFAGLVVIILVAVGLLYLIFPSLMEYYIGRFDVEDITTGRSRLMVLYNEFFFSSLAVTFFGVGLHSYEDKLLNIYNAAYHVPHNGIQELLVAWGFPGLIMLCVLWLAMILRSRQLCRKQHLLNYIPLLILLLKIQAGQMLTSAYTMLAFSYAYLSMTHDFQLEDPAEIPRGKKD